MLDAEEIGYLDEAFEIKMKERPVETLVLLSQLLDGLGFKRVNECFLRTWNIEPREEIIS